MPCPTSIMVSLLWPLPHAEYIVLRALFMLLDLAVVCAGIAAAFFYRTRWRAACAFVGR